MYATVTSRSSWQAPATYCDLVPRSPLFFSTKTERQRTAFAGVGRIIIGVALLFPTILSLRLFGIPEKYDSAALRAMGRLFGIRDIALGVWALAVRDQSSGSGLIVWIDLIQIRDVNSRGGEREAS
jgi:hypothetical protein